jgi:Ser/Thr protein kinase RdoA (MazF antagonist)
MTATSPRVTAPPDELLDAVGRRYEGGPFRFVAALEGGWANDVFLLVGRRERFVLRHKHPPSDPASVAWEHDVLARIAPVVPATVAPLVARDGSTFFLFDDDAVWLMPAIDGEPADRERDAHRIAAGRLLGQLHATTAGLDPGERPGIDGLRRLRALDAAGLPVDWRERVTPLREDALATLEELEHREPLRGVVHGDFFRGNVLVRGDDVVALIDWEEAHVAPLVSELANGVWEFTKSKVTHDFDGDAAARFVAAYREAGGPVPPDEEDLVVPLIRAKRVLELLRAPTDRFVDWEYQEHNLLAAERLA